MSDKHCTGAGLSDRVQPVEIALGVDGRSGRHDPWSTPPGIWVKGDNGIAGDDHVTGRQEQWPCVCPGVNTICGAPGTGSTPLS